MGRIQSSVGLVTGVAIEDTVNQLIALNAIPRDRLISRNAGLQQEQVALTELTTLVVGVELTTQRLGQASLFRASTVESSDSGALTARNVGSPNRGTYSFQPVRTAQAQQLSSSLLASSDQTVGTGEVVIHTGGFLDQSVSLDSLNGGAGVSRGLIELTDKSGNSKTIDLRFAQNASDVVDAINASDALGVVAEINGDHFTLTDVSGGAGTLSVDEVGGGTTAAGLGLAGISTSSTSVDGAGIQSLSGTTGLSTLRDGRGLELDGGSATLEFALADGTTVNLDEDINANSASLDQLVDAINEAGSGDIEARISADGKRLEVEDLTAGAGTFQISSPTGTLAEQLGLDNTASGGVITGDKLLAGLADVSLDSLGGGQGLGTLGQISITDRSGASDTIDLSSAETLGDVVDAINASSSQVTAQLNKNKTGIEIVDQSGSTANSLVIADADASNSATALKIAASVDESSVDSGSLERQFVGRNTKLSDYNQGRGVGLGTFTITDSSGTSSTVSLAGGAITTIGDVIDKINTSTADVTASINDAGDGIVIVDNASGTADLNISDTGGGSAASDLGIAGAGTSIDVAGATVTGIDGSRTLRITTDSETTVADLAEQINDLGSSPLNANLINLSSAGGVRLLLSGTSTGSAGRVAIDTDLSLGLTQTSAAQDALLAIGSSDNSGGVLVSSSSNSFNGLVDDLEFTIVSASDTPVTVTVGENPDNVSKQVQTFVDQYNKVKDKLDELTVFDEASQSVGILFGKNSALRVDFAFSRLLSGRVGGTGSLQSLRQVGVELAEGGKLRFNKSSFDSAYATDPDAVEEFFAGKEVFDEARYEVALAADSTVEKEDFTSRTSGFSTLAKSVTDTLASVESGALLNSSNTLTQQIEQNRERIDNLDVRLDKQRTRLLSQFYRMEQVIASLQNNLSSINGIQPITI